MPRPSSPVIAKASITCTYSLDPITVGPVTGPPLRACLRHFATRLSCSHGQARYNSTLRLQGSHQTPQTPYLPELLKSQQPSTLVTVSIKSVDRCCVPQSIGHTCAVSTRPVSLRVRPGARLDAGHGGADRDRTDDPLLAKQVLSQLSYSPASCFAWCRRAPRPRRRCCPCACV